MRAVIQRVDRASVAIDAKTVASIQSGLVIFLGIERGDNSSTAQHLAEKIGKLRIFNDQSRKMNLPIKEAGGELLVVSQFTLCADLKKGLRPSFERAQRPEAAKKLYLEFINHLKGLGLKVKQGIFQEYMTVHIDNDGPVTFILET
jgi:D-tyrosyl-tRNA(Tyr) deacylase